MLLKRKFQKDKIAISHQAVNVLKIITSIVNYSYKADRTHTSLVASFEKDFENIHKQPWKYSYSLPRNDTDSLLEVGAALKAECWVCANQHRCMHYPICSLQEAQVVCLLPLPVCFLLQW